MCSGKIIIAPRSGPRIRPWPVNPSARLTWAHRKASSAAYPRMVIEHSWPFVKAPCVPRVHKGELLEVEMMTELAEGGEAAGVSADAVQRNGWSFFSGWPLDSLQVRRDGPLAAGFR
jgi:hypothetical protein